MMKCNFLNGQGEALETLQAGSDNGSAAWGLVVQPNVFSCQMQCNTSPPPCPASLSPHTLHFNAAVHMQSSPPRPAVHNTNGSSPASCTALQHQPYP